jgi:cation transport ATPase
MTASRAGKLNSSARVGVSWSAGVIRLRDEDLFGKRLGDLCVVFLRRIFALDEVKWVEIDRDRSTAEIRYHPGLSGLIDLLQRLAAAIRGQLPPDAAAFSDSFVPPDLSQSVGRVKIQRFGTILTTWDIIDDRPGRIRLRHKAIRRDATLALRISDVIENVSGVLKCRVSHVTGSVLIRFDPGLISALHLLRILERARQRPASPDRGPSRPKPVGFGLTNTSLVLAFAGEMAAPALLPACAALLVGSNLDTFRAAGRQLLHGRLGLPVLYTSIVAATLASGQFIASAAMSWMLTFWRHQYRSELTNTRRRLLGQIIQQPCYVRLATPEPNGVEIKIPIEDLKPSDVILVSAGEQIPVDGRVLQGRGLVDERMVRGVEGLNRKQPDDKVFAGSTLLVGELHIEVLRHGLQTQATALARATLAATMPPHGSGTPTLRGETFAERTVAPTMAIASLGLLVGDITTAGAILRPDYATGPELAFPLETLQAITLCLRHGIVIRDHDAIERLATTDLLVLDHHVALERTELEVDAIQVFPGCGEEDLLRYAAAAFHDLDDERAAALRSACLDRGITPLGLQPIEFATDVTLLHGNDRIKVGDLGPRARGPSMPRDQGAPCQTESEPPNSLMVGINGRVSGLIHFRHSTRLEAASTLRRLRSKRNLQVGIVSEQPHSTLTPLAASLGADFHIGSQSPDDRVRFLQYCRRRGLKVAYVGDCRIDPRIAAEAHVAISFAEDEINEMDHDPAPIWLLQPRLTKLGELWDIAHIHQRRLKVAHGCALIPNLFCVAGAFVWGFTSLASVVVTNLGTYSVYSRTAASIRSLERQNSRSFNPRPFLARGKP